MSPDQSKEFFACLAVRHTPGIGPKTWKAVLEAFDGAYQAVQAAGSWLGRGLVNKGQARAFQDQSWRPAAEQEYRAARAKGMAVLTWSDPDYPDRLRHIPDPPAFLYYCGDLSLLLNPCLAVVGARHCSGQGLEAAARISAELSAAGLTIVSGMACGIDRQAHLAGLSGIGRSIGVLGAGLDVNYPAGNADLRRDMEEKGLVVTEFGPGIRPEAGNFPFRNRIISGLSLGVLVAEAAERSGSLITARLAGDQGREVFALPGPPGRPESGGCNRLIKDGACLVETAEDVLRALAPQLGRELALLRAAAPSAPPQAPAVRTPPQAPADLSPAEAELFAILAGRDKMHIDSLGRSLGWEARKVSGTVVMLEMRGLVRQWPGMYYSLG